MDFAQFMASLVTKLTPIYTAQAVGGGHGIDHIERMIALAKRMPGEAKEHGKIFCFSMEEFEVACWLHNYDRVDSFCNSTKGLSFKEKNVLLREILYKEFLNDSPFDEEAKERIVIAVLEHPKKDDDLKNDSSLLTALRIADKIDRLSLFGIYACTAHRWHLPLYNPKKPFGYTDTSEDAIANILTNFFRVLEWFAMLPFDWARQMISLQDMTDYINFLRNLGAKISLETGIENKIEEDIKQALGAYYYYFVVGQAIELGDVKLVSSDDRRDISEINFSSSSFQVFLVKNCPRPLGQHYHREKYEVFYFLEGKGEVFMAKVGKNGKFSNGIEHWPIRPGLTLYVPPYCSHRFDLEEGTRFVCFSSKPFDPNDLISCPIEKK